MKTIKVSDADYETLMGLSKELQLQPNHGQAFPYYWEPRSDKRDYDLNGEGEYKIVVLDSEEYDPVELAKEDSELAGEFLADQCKTEEYQTWTSWLCENKDYTLYTYNMEPKRDHNPSLFLDDVKGYIEHNQHHLGPNAHAYSNTIQRMPRMGKLVEVLYRINPQPKHDVCHEAWAMSTGKGETDMDLLDEAVRQLNPQPKYDDWVMIPTWDMSTENGEGDINEKPTIFGIVMYGLGGVVVGSMTTFLCLCYTL